MAGEWEFFRRIEEEWGLERLDRLPRKYEEYAPVGEHDLGTIQNTRPPAAGKKYADVPSIQVDYHLMTLAPVYVLAGIPFSIPEQIAFELSRNLNIITVDTSTPYFKGLGEWNTLIEGVSLGEWSVFHKNVISTCVVRRDERAYWEIVSQSVRYVPPKSGKHIEITVFMPSGMTTSYQVVLDIAGGVMDCVQCPPLRGVTERGRALLSL